ncbi:hypothetical protein M9Y10_006632 [Tritrichomonas musculus]|uniref:Protein kinase domain-containing protein n=1 Tax=Tritrichomonas musculus TaxID=1915356 RepID=A0ABR2JEP1_9EUKA
MMLEFINEIPNDTFSDLKQIGSGTYSCIFSSIHVPTDTRVALKVCLKSDDSEYMKIVDQELSIHKSLNHPLICKYFTDFETEHLTVVAMELIEGIDLLEYVNQNSGLQLKEAQSIFSQLVIAIEYLHVEHNISHRDLKLENIMVDKYGHIRLIDFGFSSPKSLMSTICGSIPYCAPEVLECQSYTKEADIWSLGIILYSLSTGNLPFYNTNINKLVNIICKYSPIYPSSIDPMARDLISRLLIKDPEQRISIEEIKTHPFISNARLLQLNYKQLFSEKHEMKNEFVPLIKKEARIKASKSNPTIDKYRTNPTYLELKRQRRYISLMSSNITINTLPITKLHKIVTKNTDNVVDLILMRKDFSSNLNKLIELAILTSNSQNDYNQHLGHIKLRSSLPFHLTCSNNLPHHRNASNHVFFPQSPVIAKPL